MYKYLPITDVYAREILDSRGNPTLEVELLAGERYWGRASVPSGASTGRFEAVELRDGEKRYGGLGVQKAVDHVNARIAPAVTDINVFDQVLLDETLRKLDGTEDKSGLGANAILGVSMAAARAAADALHMPLYLYLGGVNARRLPVPMMNIINGGVHAVNSIDFQEFLILPAGAPSFHEALRMGSEIYHTLKQILKEKGLSTAVGDEGGFAPDLPDAAEVLKLIAEAVQKSGYELRRDVVLALDAAASELYDKQTGQYVFGGEGRMRGCRITRSMEEMIDYYEDLIEKFPVVSIEDPLAEDDWDGWELLTTRLGQRTQLVGDDLFVTNTGRLKKGIERKVANAILIKVNQIGTLTEAIDAIQTAHCAGYRSILSHRSGETADTLIADMAVAFGSGQIKTGAPCRMERVEKYNRLLRIEERLGEVARYFDPFAEN